MYLQGACCSMHSRQKNQGRINVTAHVIVLNNLMNLPLRME